MSMTYVFPDLHGRFDQFNAAMAALDAQPDDTLVFLGDYIDRGPESAQLVRALRDLQDGRPNVICLSGNHEHMMMWGFAGGDEHVRGWMMNGGDKTLESYTDENDEIDMDAMSGDANWFASLPVVHEDAHRVYVHAGVNPAFDLDKQLMRDVHWLRYHPLDGLGYRGKHVVHGHDADKTGPVTFGDRTAMDVGAVWTGRYVVGVFDDNVPGGPVRVIEVTA